METMTIETVCAETPIVNATDKAKKVRKPRTPKAPKAETPKAETPKADKPEPVTKKDIRISRSAAIKADLEERASFNDCKRRLLKHGKKFLSQIGMTESATKLLTPADLREFQSDKERYKLLFGEGGEILKEELGWTLGKIANATAGYAEKHGKY